MFEVVQNTNIYFIAISIRQLIKSIQDRELKKIKHKRFNDNNLSYKEEKENLQKIIFIMKKNLF